MKKMKVIWVGLFFLIVFFMLAFLMSPEDVSTISESQRIHISGKDYLFTYDGSDILINRDGIINRVNFPEEIHILDFDIGDIDDDQVDEILVLSKEVGSKYGKALIIFKPIFIDEKISLDIMYTNDLSEIKPWKIEVCEVDGDGDKDIFIGVYKSTLYYPGMENRPFFFNFQDGKLVKKWTGSKVRQAFTDACFVDFNGDGIDEFVVLEEKDNGEKVITAYYWFGFGFIMIGESKTYEKIESIMVTTIEEKEYIRAVIEKQNSKKIILQLTDNALIERRKP